jgi:hypothetical protein
MKLALLDANSLAHGASWYRSAAFRQVLFMRADRLISRDNRSLRWVHLIGTS